MCLIIARATRVQITFKRLSLKKMTFILNNWDHQCLWAHNGVSSIPLTHKACDRQDKGSELVVVAG